MTDPRIDQAHRFLIAAGLDGATLAPLAADASFRRYHRVHLANGETRVLMDAPPEHEDVRPFHRVADHLVTLGYTVPDVLFADAEHGFLLLRDLGDQTFSAALQAGGNELALYSLAIDLLVDLHHKPTPKRAPDWLAPYDVETLIKEALLFVDWYLPAVTGSQPTDAARRPYIDAWGDVFAATQTGPRTLVLRDFHVDNLMWVEPSPGDVRCGLLDFQDALVGHPAYDVMSLLEDARRDVSPATVDAMLARYRDGMSGDIAPNFDAAFAALGAGRHAKVIGIFTRLSARDGKHGYLHHIPRVWQLLDRAVQHPTLAPVKHWLNTHASGLQQMVPRP